MAFQRMEATVSGLRFRKENLCLIPDNLEDIAAAGVPVAYLTAQMTLSFAGFAKGMTVLSPAIGGSVGKRSRSDSEGARGKTRDINHD
jgi:NADPH:quinone reductase-like Zn-dependent oxidoreductase